ncbi:MAG: MaoC/PaaZ C-terminal domain-containing protein [Ferrimicrobium acidiphilum]
MSLEWFWEDYSVGQKVVTGGRTVVDADARMFFGATDASHPAHLDLQYAEKHPFRKLTAPGSLIIGIVDGLVVRYLVPQEHKVIHYGYDRIRFVHPVFFGDTIHLEASLVEKRFRDDEFGMLVFAYEIKNQESVTVSVITDLQLVESRHKEVIGKVN